MTITLLEFDGILIEIIRKPIKNIHFRIYPPDGRVRVSVPHRLRLRTIEKQIEAKRAWIFQQRANLKEEVLPIRHYENGEEHYFMGKSYPLLVHQAVKPRVILKDEILHCFLKPDIALAKKEKILESWYRQQMAAQIPALIAKWEKIIGVTVLYFGIKKMKTRWGSCNPVMKRVWLNLNLIKKPLVCLEYVIVHELVHLLEASHSKRFYALMDKFLPNWRKIQDILEKK